MEVEEVRLNDETEDDRIEMTSYANSTASGSASSTVELINHIAYNYVALFIVAVGIIGNLLNLIVLTRPKLKGVMYVYLLGLAVSNLCVLIIAIPALIAITSPQCSRAYAKAYFQAHLMIPLLNCFMAWSVYIIICMTINRYISIYMPTYFQRIHTFKNAYVAIFFSFLGGVILHVPLSLENVVVPCQSHSSIVVPIASENTLLSSSTDTYKLATNRDIADHPLYNVYLWVSETLLRLGPIVTLTILNILIIVRFNRIAKKKEHLKGPAVHRTTNHASSANHKKANGSSLRRSASPAATHLSTTLNGGTLCVNGSVSPVDTASIIANGSSPSNGGNHLTVPGISIDTTSSGAMDLPVETDPKTTTTALSACLEVSAAGGTSDSKNGRSGSVTSTRALGTRGTPHRTSTRGRRGLHNPEERMLVVVLIAIVVLFVVCTTPAAFLSLSITGERKKHVGFSIFRACSNNLELLGFALNFFVYCLCSADIRAAFVDVLFDNILMLWLRRKWASKSLLNSPSNLAAIGIEEHELQGINEKNVVKATLQQSSIRNQVANV